MTISLKHAKQSTVPDVGDDTLIQPSDWNDEHVLTQASDRILGRRTSGAGATEELTGAQTKTLLGLGNLANKSLVEFLDVETGLIRFDVEDVAITTPPGSPTDGQMWIVPASGATGDWSGQENKIARWDSSGVQWVFYAPSGGWTAYNAEAQSLLVYKTSGWTSVGESVTPVFETISDITAHSFTQIPSLVQCVGYNAVDDGGGAFYANPVASDPGAKDQIFLPSVSRYLRRVHENGYVDIAKHGVYDDGRDQTTQFMDALALAVDLGVNKVVARAGGVYHLQEGLIDMDEIFIDMNGATLLGSLVSQSGFTTAQSPVNILNNLPSGADFTPLGLRTGKVADASFVTYRENRIKIANATIDGGLGVYTTLEAATQGGHPLLFFAGGEIELENIHLTKNGNYDGAIGVTRFLDYRNQGVLIHDAEKAIINNFRSTDSACENLCVQSHDARTVLQMKDRYGSKKRGWDSNYHTNSYDILYNLNAASRVENVHYKTSRKSGMNALTPGVFRNLYHENCTESSAFDFNEAALAGLGQIDVEGVRVDAAHSAAVRVTGSNVRISQYDVANCLYAILVEGNISETQTVFPELPQEDRELFNVVVGSGRSRGHNAQSTSDNALVRAVGVAGKPVHITLDNAAGEGDGNWPATKSEYGFWGDNVDLVIKGALKEGRSALAFLTGEVRLTLDGAQLLPEPGQSLHCIQIDDATIKSDIVVKNSARQTALDSGFHDIEITGTTAFEQTNGAFRLENSDTLTELQDLASHRVLRDGAIFKRVTKTATTLVSHSRFEFSETVTGARVGDHVTVTVEENDNVIFCQGYVTASNSVYCNLLNYTSTDVSGNDYDICIQVTPAGYDRS